MPQPLTGSLAIILLIALTFSACVDVTYSTNTEDKPVQQIRSLTPNDSTPENVPESLPNSEREPNESNGKITGPELNESNEENPNEISVPSNNTSNEPPELEPEWSPELFEDRLEKNQNAFPTSLAKSTFFKSNPIAEQILSSQLTSYSMNEFQGSQENNRFTFAFNVLNALRMLGYPVLKGSNYTDPYKSYLRAQGLTETDMVTREALEKLDQQLAELETSEKTIAHAFPLYDEFIEENLEGEPSKNHQVSLFAHVFDLLPEKIKPNREALQSFITFQLPDGAGDPPPDARVCNARNQCKISYRRTHFASTLDENHPNTIFILTEDLRIAGTILHEFAHYLDANLYNSTIGPKAGSIDTREFYSISYDLGTHFVPGEINWSYFRIHSGQLDEKEKHFVTEYAIGWQREENPDYFTAYEDFAESFTQYVFAGNIFRCKAETFPILKQKYDWLKENVFEGWEYATPKAQYCDGFYSHPQDHITLVPELTRFTFNDILKFKSKTV